MRQIIYFSFLFILLISCSQRKALNFPVMYKGWVQVPITDTSYSTSFFGEDGRIRLSFVKEGDFQASWNLDVLNGKNIVFGFKAEEVQIIVSPGRGVSLKLNPFYVEHPSEALDWDDFEFVLSETSEFFMLYDRPDEIEPSFYIEGIVKLNDNARSRRIKRLITKIK